MKSKYKLKIKEISMRLKNGSVLLLSIFCLFALASAVQAVPWTDPTCAAPDCNTDGPIWVNPEDPQDSNAASTKPMIYIQDTREISTPAASAYVRSALDGKPAIYGYGLGNNSLSYGGEFKADYAPGLKVSGGVIVDPLGLDPTDYQVAGLLYLNSGSYANQFRYYSGGSWRTLNPWINAGNELYYSLAAGNARGVAIKNGDLTGPTDAYTLDVYRKTSTDADPAYYAERALYARLASYSSDANYASGFIGGYDDYGNLVGVRGKVETSSTDPHYGGYFEATGPTGYGVQGIASNSGSTMNVGGTFSALGTNGVGVSGGAPAYGGYFQATGATGIGVAANGPSTPTETAYAIRTNDGAIAMGEIATIPDEQTNYGMIYVKQDGLDNKIYFKSEGNVEYDLTAGADASGNIADGTVTGQMTHWNDTAAEWQPVANTDMLWDNTNKNLGIGTGSPFSDNKLHVVKSASSGSPVAVYATAENTSVVGGTVYGVYGSATSTGNAVPSGGYFVATGTDGRGVSGSGPTAGGYFLSNGSGGAGAYGWSTNGGRGVQGYSSDATNGYGGYFESDGASTSASAGVRALGVSKGVWGSVISGDGVYGYGGYFTSSGVGADVIGVYGETTSYVAAGVKGVATANGESDSASGGYFTTASGTGSGVRGIASYSTGGTTNYGGYFSAAGSAGRGVYGSATGTSTAYGGYFSASGSGNTGAGVYGVNSSTTGLNYGGYFTNASSTTNAAGVYGENTASGDIDTYGGYFVTNGYNSGSAGVYGTTAVIASSGVMGVSSFSGTGSGYGGSFSAASTTGRAVYGEATGTGANYGGYFYSSSNTGRGVYGLATGSTGRAIEGYASYSTGTNYGGYFQADGSTGRGVYSTVSGSGSTAVYGTSSGTGTAYGGFFSVTGASNTGIAVYAGNSSTTGYAGYFAGRVYSSSKFLTYASDSSANPGYSWFGDEDTGLYRYTTDVISVSTGGTENLRIGGNQMGMYASDTVSAPGYTWIGDTNMGMYRSGTDTIGFATAGVNRMTIGSASTGQVLISTGSGYGLSVEQTVNNISNTQAALLLDRSGASSTTSAYYLIDFHRAGVSQGSVTVTNATVAYNAFTGAHYAWTSEKISRGMLVDLVSDNKLYNENPESEVIYGVNMTTNANSKNVLGAYLSKGEYNFDDKIIKTPDLIMSVGNGDMWVADNGSNLEIGDYLISSDVPGHAMKVTDEYPTAYVVARVAENVDWSKVEEKTEDGIKHKKISVLFESFILNQNLGLAFDKNQNLDDLSWFYAMDPKTPIEKAVQTQKQQLDALETKVEMIEKNDNAELMEYIKQLEARIEALEAQNPEPVKTSFWSKLW